MGDHFTQPTIEPLGDKAILVSFGNQMTTQTHRSIQSFLYQITANPFPWMMEAVPAYTSVAVYYNPLILSKEISPYLKIKDDLESLLKNMTLSDTEKSINRTIKIPVCYGDEYGPDLLEVAEHNHLTPEEVITYHTEGDYLVHMIGFAPGFPYLGGMTEKLATPRRQTPRLEIPAGSVGIAGGQTGVYPLESPGGWQIIGRTPLQLFRPKHEPPSLLRAGDHVRFYSISKEELDKWGGKTDDD